jgi:hypothetical protein
LAAIEPRIVPVHEPTTAEVMAEFYGQATDASGRIIATPAQLAAHQEVERRKEQEADERMARAALWNETMRSSFGTMASSLSPNALRILKGLREAAAERAAGLPAPEMFGQHVITPELRSSLEGLKAEQDKARGVAVKDDAAKKNGDE